MKWKKVEVVSKTVQDSWWKDHVPFQYNNRLKYMKIIVMGRA